MMGDGAWRNFYLVMTNKLHLMTGTTNLFQLTKSHRAIQSKKRAQRNQIKQVIFDEDDRRYVSSPYHNSKLTLT